MSRKTKIEQKLQEVREKLIEEGEDRIPLDSIEHYQELRRHCEVFQCKVWIDGEKYRFEQAMTFEAIEDGNVDGLVEEMCERNMKKLEEAASLKYTQSIHSGGDAVDAIICRVNGHVRCLKCDEKITEFDAEALKEAQPEDRAKAKRFMIGQMFEHGAGLHYL